MSRKIGFGIIGTGSIAQVHATAIKAIPEANLVGVYNIHFEKARIFSERFGCTAYISLDEMLGNKEIEVVCICTPSGLHMEPALNAITANKHCIIEKPLEISTARCNAIIESAERQGVRVATVFPSRFYEVNLELKKAVEEKRFGHIAMADVYVKWYRTPEYYASAAWRGTLKYDGGGALMNQGIHSVDLLQWMMGPAESVIAFSSNSLHKNIEAEDTCSAVVRFKNGALGNIACSTAIYPGFSKRIEIMGSEGSAVIEETNILKWEFKNEHHGDSLVREKFSAKSEISGGASRPDDISFYGHQKQIEDMLLSIKTNKAPSIDGHEGYKSVAIIEAIYRSARENKAIYLK